MELAVADNSGYNHLPMNDFNSSRSRSSIRSHLLIICLLVSLVLHVLVVLMLPLIQTTDDVQIKQHQPTIVRLVDIPRNEKKPKLEGYELDQVPFSPPTPILTPPPKKAERADRDQQVIKEQAPLADDVRDETTVKPPLPQRHTVRPPQPAKPSAPVTGSRPSSSGIPRLKADQAPPQPQLPPAPEPLVPSTQNEPAQEAGVPKPLPPTVPNLSPEQLLPDADTLGKIAAGKLGQRNRMKQRDDVEIGDTVWLNLQNDLLVSFFRRFHDRVERVWNYPAEALRKEEQGTLELLIIVNKEGELLDVDLKQTSGSDLLDYEAIQAIYRAAPFGPLSRYYPHEQLKIRAYFSYNLTGRFIYGR
ncbi:energy transducer TonB [Pelobacter seleniigenes]|uniref:energy transducer TonB n=1 Tax=Pelobacter seleniigenes TaxID=407188 RepID=UPI0004A7147F|nr:TonB family protein [Pelobacter seleniigenes]